MRWLVGHPGPSFSVHDVYKGWAEALIALGEEVAVYNLDDRLKLYQAALIETGNFDGFGYPEIKRALTDEQAVSLAAAGLQNTCYAWWPDVVLLVSAFFTPPLMLDMMRSRGHKVILLHTESPYEDERQLIRAQHADVNLLNDPVNLDKYRRLGIPAEYMPHRYRPSLHHPGPAQPKLTCDLAFVGTAFESRIAFFEQMGLDGLDVLLAGHWKMTPEDSPLRKYVAHDIEECLDNDSAAEIYRAAKCGINIYRREGEPGQAQGVALGPREIEMAACGLFFLRDPRPEGDALFPALPTFTGPQDASEKLRYYLKRDDLREKLAGQARAAIADRTFENAAIQLLRLLDSQPVSL